MATQFKASTFKTFRIYIYLFPICCLLKLLILYIIHRLLEPILKADCPLVSDPKIISLLRIFFFFLFLGTSVLVKHGIRFSRKFLDFKETSKKINSLIRRERSIIQSRALLHCFVVLMVMMNEFPIMHWEKMDTVINPIVDNRTGTIIDYMRIITNGFSFWCI